MSRYITTHFPQYQSIGVYDENGVWTKDLNGNNEYDEVYIICTCYKGAQLYDFSSKRGILEFYCPSSQKGHSILKQYYDTLYGDSEKFNIENTNSNTNEKYYTYDWDGLVNHINSLNDDRLFHVTDLDNEVLFRFKFKYANLVIPFIKPKLISKGAASPFSNKHLPSHKEKLRAKRELEASYNTYKTPKGYYDKVKNLLPMLSRKWSCKSDETLRTIQDKFNTYIGKDLIKQAQEENYKYNHYLLKNNLWNEFEDFIESELNQ